MDFVKSKIYQFCARKIYEFLERYIFRFCKECNLWMLFRVQCWDFLVYFSQYFRHFLFSSSRVVLSTSLLCLSMLFLSSLSSPRKEICTLT
jgi:hypothetical protein